MGHRTREQGPVLVLAARVVQKDVVIDGDLIEELRVLVLGLPIESDLDFEEVLVLGDPLVFGAEVHTVFRRGHQIGRDLDDGKFTAGGLCDGGRAKGERAEGE